MTTTPVSVVTKLSAGEVELIATALATYAFKGPRQLTEMKIFAHRHPEFGLIVNQPEPTPEEDR